MTLEDFLNKLKQQPETVSFSDTMHIIDTYYDYKPSAFTNGETTNDEGTNEGSCKIFGFAKLNELNEQSTLHCFGDYYRQDVLKKPLAKDHANIRNFIKSGWRGIRFEQEPLTFR